MGNTIKFGYPIDRCYTNYTTVHIGDIVSKADNKIYIIIGDGGHKRVALYLLIDEKYYTYIPDNEKVLKTNITYEFIEFISPKVKCNKKYKTFLTFREDLITYTIHNIWTTAHLKKYKDNTTCSKNCF
jgi:hypothetical protein